MADAVVCKAGLCCLHKNTNPTTITKDTKNGTLMTVNLLAGELQPVVGLAELSSGEISKLLDQFTDKLRVASFIFKTLTDRVSELQAAVEGQKKAPPTITPPTIQAPVRPRPPLEPSSRLSPFQQSPTPPTTPSANNASMPDWTQRCAAYYQKRLAQQEATTARLAKHEASKNGQAPPSVSNPLQTPPNSGGPFNPRSRAVPSPRPKPLFDHSKKDELTLSTWRSYESKWDMISKALNADARPFLTMTTVPWPIIRTEYDSEEVEEADITSEDIENLLLSPLHSVGKPRDVRIRDAYLRWHPDKATRWLSLVVANERPRVKMMVDRVAFALNNLK